MRFDPRTYPGRRPAQATLVWDGQEHPLDLDRPEPTVPTAEPPVLLTSDRCWVLAYGSNACPDRLVDKGLDEHGALLLPAVASGWAAAWEARRSSTGAVPLTLVPAPSNRLETWVLGLHPDDLQRLDASEGRGSRYVVGVVGDVAVAARWQLAGALAYGPAGMTRVLVDDDGTMMTHPPVGQAEAAARLDAGGGSTVAPGLPEALDDAWPPRELRPLDFFVYGTLRPGEQRWSAIADLVDVVGEASVPGRVWSTGRGYPAAAFSEDDDGEVRGMLLRPRGDGAEAYATTDAIEAEGELFARVAVRADGPDGPGWAAAYAWI
jgi:gamma-glutamylcyclotransferase (GGCT)/AIG2-like uncharacterized protein YtfP